MVWFDREAIANIFGFKDLVKLHRITYDSEKEDAFLVHTPNGIIKFKGTPEGLYQYHVSQKYRSDLKKGMSNLVSTVIFVRKPHFIVLSLYSHQE